MPTTRNTLIAAILTTALCTPAAFAAQATDPAKPVTPPPTAGGNSAEPDRTGTKPPMKGVKEGTSAPNRAAQPSAGGNSAEPDRTKGGKGAAAVTPHDSKIDPKYPSAGGNSASKDAPARTSEKPDRK